MADRVELTLDDAEFRRQINRLRRNVRPSELTKALQKGAQPILAEARRLVPIGKTKQLKKSLKLKQKTRKDEQQVAVVATAPHAHLVELGTQAHQQGKGRHPGAQPKPFIRPAFDEKKDEAVERTRAALRSAIDKIAK